MLRASTFLGKPSKLKNNPDYVPSLFSYSVTGNKSQQRIYRYERFEKRQNLIPAENSGRESNEGEDEQFVAITQQHSTDHESVTSGGQVAMKINLRYMPSIALTRVLPMG